MTQGDLERSQLLPTGAHLHQFRIEQVLGQGGFGVTYLAEDTTLGSRVAIKEYFPSMFAARTGNHIVVPRYGACADEFAWGKERFLGEAHILSQFKHPSLVRVQQVFELFGTAYMVMGYVDGESLSQRLKRRTTPWTLPEISSTVLPILDGLEEIHVAGFLHRDITPGTIIVGFDGTPVLVDFGAARQTLGSSSGVVINLVTPGYTPLEQYWRSG